MNTEDLTKDTKGEIVILLMYCFKTKRFGCLLSK